MLQMLRVVVNLALDVERLVALAIVVLFEAVLLAIRPIVHTSCSVRHKHLQ